MKTETYINKIDEAKKYMGKTIYTASDSKKRGKFILGGLSIGGIGLFYNQVNYTVDYFALYEDEKCSKYWGKVDLKDISDVFSEKDHNWYFFSSDEALKYVKWRNLDEVEREKNYDIETAKELLSKHNIKYSIII